ncbi:MAG: hypothetical protein ACXWYS_03705, partial [Gaiellaceae bacterium]
MSSLADASRRVGAWRLTEPRSIGIVGMLLGGLAAWLALPPVMVRSPWVPVAVGMLAIFAGIWSVTRGGG